MTLALFITDFPPSESLPPMEDLQYINGDGELAGGYSCVGNVPEATTSVVWVDTSDAMIVTMQADPDYFYIEPVALEEDLSDLAPTYIDDLKAYLIAHGHNRGQVTSQIKQAIHKRHEVRTPLCVLHNIHTWDYDHAKTTVKPEKETPIDVEVKPKKVK